MFLQAHAEQKHRKLKLSDKKMHNYIFLTTIHLMFDFDPLKKRTKCFFKRVTCTIEMPQTIIATVFFTLRSFFLLFQNRQSGDETSFYPPPLVCTSL